MKRATMMLAATLFLIAAMPVGAQEAPVPTPPFARYTRTEVLWVARLCVHETTWRGGIGEGATTDCGGIYQVILNRMAPGETISGTLSRITPRFWRGTTTRSWTRHLIAGPIREDPPGWPENWPDARVFNQRWRAVYTRTRDFMEGREPLPCEGRVEHWFGRETDSERLAEWLSNGRWVEATCRGSQRNAFLTRAPELEPQLGG